MISLDLLLSKSDLNIHSFRIIRHTKCKRQINDQLFEYTNDQVKKGEVYDGKIIRKEDTIYLFLGYDDSLGYEVYIPVFWDKTRVLNITIIEDK